MVKENFVNLYINKKIGADTSNLQSPFNYLKWETTYNNFLRLFLIPFV